MSLSLILALVVLMVTLYLIQKRSPGKMPPWYVYALENIQNIFLLLFIYATVNIVNYRWHNGTEWRTEQRHKQPTCFVKIRKKTPPTTTFSTAVTLYTRGVFLTALNLASFMGTPSPAVLQSAGLHQQSGFGTGDMCEPSWAMQLKNCFHLGKLGLYITVVELI